MVQYYKESVVETPPKETKKTEPQKKKKKRGRKLNRAPGYEVVCVTSRSQPTALPTDVSAYDSSVRTSQTSKIYIKKSVFPCST